MSPAGYTVHVDGMRELRQAFREVGESLEDFRAVNGQVAGWVGPQAASAAPRQSGMLAASWRPAASVTQASVKFGGGLVPYAGVIHWGTPAGYRAGAPGPHNIAGRMWATTTVADTESQWAQFYEHFIDLALAKAGF